MSAPEVLPPGLPLGRRDWRWINRHHERHGAVIIDRHTGRALCDCGARRQLRIRWDRQR